jgi:hypothetical protein
VCPVYAFGNARHAGGNSDSDENAYLASGDQLSDHRIIMQERHSPSVHIEFEEPFRLGT